MKKYVFILIVPILAVFAFVLLKKGNDDENIRKVRICSTTESDFSSVFSFTKEINFYFYPDSLYGIDCFAVDRKGNFIICDVLGHQLMVYDSSGAFLFKMAGRGQGPGEVESPALIAIDPTTDNIVISDFHQRRISVFNANYEFTDSFIIRSDHGQPLEMTVKNNLVYLGANRMTDSKSIHIYTIDGRYLKSMFERPPQFENTGFQIPGRAIFDFNKNQMFATYTYLYNIYHFNEKNELIQQYDIDAGYFVRLSDALLSQQSIESVELLKASRIQILQVYNNYIFMTIEMPRKVMPGQTSRDVVNNTAPVHIIDIFDLEGKNIFSNIKPGDYRLAYIDKLKGDFYFRGKADFEEGKYSLLVYAYKGHEK